MSIVPSCHCEEGFSLTKQSPPNRGIASQRTLATKLHIRSKRRGAKAPRQCQRAKVYHGITVLSRNYDELFLFSYSVKISLSGPAKIDNSEMPGDRTEAP